MSVGRGWLVGAGVSVAWLGLSVLDAGAVVTLDSDLSVLETYNDNLFFTEANKKEDFGTFVSPRLKLTYESRNVVISGTYRGTAQFFVNNSQENAYAQNSNFSFDFPGLTKRYKGLEVELIESFNFSPQLQAFSFAGEPGQERRGGGGVVCRSSPCGTQRNPMAHYYLQPETL